MAFFAEMPASAKAGLGVAAAAVPGAMLGALATLLKRKSDNEQSIRVPSETVKMPLVHRGGAEKAAFTPTVGHAVGATIGAVGTYSILNHLINRKDQRHLDMSLKEREDKLNQLLAHEQSLSAGIPKAAMALVKRASDSRRAVDALEKIAESMFYEMTKKAGPAADRFTEHLNRPLSDVLANAKQFVQAYPYHAVAMAGGAYLGARKAYEAHPNTIAAKAVKDSLKERLTGKDNLVGPMPIRVESDRVEMQPLKPGASSLVDPTKGRDVLSGI